MDVFVVGAGGLLGSNVVKTAVNRGLSVAGSYHSTRADFEIPLRELDVRASEGFEELLTEFSPSVVVNCAAMTDVDECEKRPELAHKINADAPEAMARRCSDRGIGFVHVSTDYVFDGETDEQYGEESEPNPLQVYGQSKLAGDRNVRSAHDSPLVVRPSFVYGVNRAHETAELDGFPVWVRSRLTAGQAVPLFTDQYVTPSRAGSTAETLLDLIDDGASGTYHVAARSCVTPYEFGRIIASTMGVETDALDKGSQSDVDRPAARPSNTCLDVEKVEARFGRSQPTLQQDVDAIASYF
ncbi:dTDP-4-dehydrorhamnose reductase [Halobacterium noricense]|uniref:dTDP-4-dehydrorhamnose reductase n=1 Tax=Halobacterium noricense TaxID=223182 RepID=UPI001E5389EC|nr:dTDP-4-dehydrorhamnose reductase [Halobacterium noricense]UHH26563.1 dTDP-4-dehydrorhamnose reductase [Halobacterium noricense]